jgi:hypothetical protein
MCGNDQRGRTRSGTSACVRTSRHGVRSRCRPTSRSGHNPAVPAHTHAHTQPGNGNRDTSGRPPLARPPPSPSPSSSPSSSSSCDLPKPRRPCPDACAPPVESLRLDRGHPPPPSSNSFPSPPPSHPALDTLRSIGTSSSSRASHHHGPHPCPNATAPAAVETSSMNDSLQITAARRFPTAKRPSRSPYTRT